MLLRRIRRCFDDEMNAGSASNEVEVRWIPKKSRMWGIVDVILPYHSGRREWIKKIYWNSKK